jgi:demethylmenaquinone methyltransferase/2-methoxy-6-polyprenyl-1,4-benzoquinol methylase
MSHDPSSADFGFRAVAPDEKTRLVGEVFRSVAPRYDLMNDLMSFGVHRLWKREFVGTSGVREGARVLDLASGTGDIAALLADAVGAGGEVVASDINPAMLALGRERLTDQGRVANLDYALANAEALPFADRSFSLVTIAFGLRNVTDKALALREIHRVLDIAGRVLILEFSEVRHEALKALYDLYSFEVLPRLGRAVAGDEASYRYLAESIRKHPNQETLKDMMMAAGFERVSWRNLSGGVVAIHSGYRI